MIPNWPGFLRLSLNEEERDSLEACKQELDDFVEAMAVDFPHMTFTDKGGGLVQLSAYRRRPMRVMKFCRGPARALALEFYPENVDEFLQELPKAKAALLDWRAEHGDRCEVVLFTTVSRAEHHAAIDSAIQQACRNENELAPLLRSLEVRVAFHIDPERDPVKDYVLAKAVPVAAVRPKPWWRFW
jgi:hypothetical protein